jgi:[acyl-carrier-protein] S-malonyltransferase
LGKTAVIFPGQGAQAVGMGKDFVEASPAAAAIFERADRVLGFDFSRVCFDGPAERLNATDMSQPAIFATSVAIWHALIEKGVAEELAPQAMAGLSLGEYTALHAAGWIDFDEALRLVAQRGRLMQSAAEAVDSSMVSVLGGDEAKVVELCAAAAEGDVLVPANFNCPGQIVISGHQRACNRAVNLAEKFDLRAVPITVAGAFHSPLMEPAVRGLADALQATHIRPGRIAVVSNVSADYHADPNSVRALLTEQCARPIRWQASMERLIAAGCDRFVEIGPGRVLTGLMRKINRGVATQCYNSAASLENVPA